MESAAPQTPVQALEALQNAYSRFLDALPEARRASLGEAIGFFLRSDGNPKLGSLVDAFAEELPVRPAAPLPGPRPPGGAGGALPGAHPAPEDAA